MKRFQQRVFTLLLTFSLSFAANAQSISGSIGGGSLFTKGHADALIGMSVRGNFLRPNDALSVSVGTHAGVGFGRYWEPYGDLDLETNYLVLDLPIVVEMNIGGYSSPDIRDKFGFFLGGGYGFRKLGVDFFGVIPINATGPIVNTGIRFPIGGLGYELRGSVMMNKNSILENQVDHIIYGLNFSLIF